MIFSYDEFDLSGVRTYPLSSRASKANAVDFAKPHVPGGRFSAFVDSLPSILAGNDFKAVVRAIQTAKAADAGIVWGIGAHVIKTGLSPILIDLMKRGFVSAIAMNGAGVIHDFELALSGATSEDVDAALGPGRFGMADETGRLLNGAIRDAVRAGKGIGGGVSEYLAGANAPHASVSILATAAQLNIPVTVHVAIGTDIIHMHPDADGARARRRQPAGLQVLRLERRPPERRRVPELRLGGRAPGGVSEGRRAGAKHRREPRRTYYRQSRFHPALSSPDQRRHRVPSRASARAIRSSGITRS